MIRIKIVILSLALIWGCSAANEKIINNDSLEQNLKSTQDAQELFIQGSLEEFNGDYNKAVLYYERALELDPSAGIYFTLSKNYLRLNKLSRSLQYARNAVKLDSTNQEYLMQLGSVYFMARQTDSAAALFKKVVELDSSNYQAYYFLGQSLENTKPSEALAVYEKLLLKAGLEWDVLLRIAELNARLGNDTKTIETIQNLINLDPSNLQLQKYLVEALLNIQDYTKALEVIDKNLISFPDDLELIEYRAKSLFSLNKKDESVNEYLKLISDNDLDYFRKHMIAVAFMNEVQKDSSIIPYAFRVITAIEKDTINSDLDLYLADLSEAMKKDSLAVFYLERAAENTEWNSQVFVRMAFLLFKTQKYEKLISKMKVPSEKFPDNFIINFFVGLSYNQINKYSEALPFFEKCVRINPNDVDALHSLGYTLYQLKRGAEAVYFIKDALKIQPNNIDLLSTLALIYENLKEWKISDSLYENILIRSPENSLVLNNYAYSLAERDDSLSYAFELSKKSLELEPENASYLDTFGWILYKMNKADEAVKYIQKAISKEDDNSTLFDHLGDIFIKLGERQNAVDAWQKAFKLDSSREGIKEKIKKVNND